MVFVVVFVVMLKKFEVVLMILFLENEFDFFLVVFCLEVLEVFFFVWIVFVVRKSERISVKKICIGCFNGFEFIFIIFFF